MRRSLGIVAALVLVLGACTDDRAAPSTTGSGGGDRCAEAGLPTTVPYSRPDGFDPDETSLDVHAPERACGAPVVIWVHGGGYRIGDKAQQMTHKAPLFNRQGWILVSVNYRLTRPGVTPTAAYPDHYVDVATAVAWVHRNIARYGGDPDRVALLGHSAGADIVSNVLLQPDYLAEAGASVGDLACAGPLDSEGFDKVAAGDADIRGLEQEWVAALGNLPDYRTATSANHLIRPGLDLPPVIGAVRGSKRRRRIEEEFLRKLAEVGVATTRIDASSLTHHQVNSHIGLPGDEVMTPPLMRFLSGCFGEG